MYSECEVWIGQALTWNTRAAVKSSIRSGTSRVKTQEFGRDASSRPSSESGRERTQLCTYCKYHTPAVVSSFIAKAPLSRQFFCTIPRSRQDGSLDWDLEIWIYVGSSVPRLSWCSFPSFRSKGDRSRLWSLVVLAFVGDRLLASSRSPVPFYRWSL